MCSPLYASSSPYYIAPRWYPSVCANFVYLPDIPNKSVKTLGLAFRGVYEYIVSFVLSLYVYGA